MGFMDFTWILTTVYHWIVRAAQPVCIELELHLSGHWARGASGIGGLPATRLAGAPVGLKKRRRAGGRRQAQLQAGFVDNKVPGVSCRRCYSGLRHEIMCVMKCTIDI